MTFVALITGASSGIGEATARRLAREGDVQVVLVARREERLRALAAELGRADVISADLTEQDAPMRIAAQVEARHGALHLLVNNAGARWNGEFADTGWAGVQRHMQLNFDAQVRLTEALLPLLHRTVEQSPPDLVRARRWAAPVSIVNVASTSGRVARLGAGSYSASKFALIGWSDSLHLEEQARGIHVGLVLPGFIATEGFPAAELRARSLTRRIVSTPDVVAEAIVQAGPGGRAERYTPRYYWLAAAARLLAPSLLRRATSGDTFTTTTPGNG
ncbi:MAG TPA: SDR family NAD(P)-dependent oxidoreductase [Solirubrobacteraceae bacterium]|nr:SDR family NAD(P)-dependent oxidoreductase [Solirubrobacteraceae bacterium]